MLDFDPFSDMASLLSNYEVKTIVDGGAFIGTIAEKLASTFERAIVHAFEPQQESFEQLEQQARTQPRLRAYRMALGAASRPSTLKIGVLPYTSSLLDRPVAGKAYYPQGAVLYREQPVEMVSLDEWCVGAGVPAVDVLKLDVQGFELQVLEGAVRNLRNSIQLIYTEVSFVPLYEHMSLFHDLSSFLHKFGFSLYRLYDLHHAADGQLIYGDAIFVSGQVRKLALG